MPNSYSMVWYSTQSYSGGWQESSSFEISDYQPQSVAHRSLLVSLSSSMGLGPSVDPELKSVCTYLEPSRLFPLGHSTNVVKLEIPTHPNSCSTG